MGKTKCAVGNEVEVEMLIGKLVFYAKNIKYGDGDQIKANLNWDSWPLDKFPEQSIGLALTASLAQAADPTQNQGNRYDERKPVARDF